MNQANRTEVSRLLLAILALGLCCTGGCSFYRDSISDHQLDQGLTIILPGIEGESFANGNVARGLQSAGVESAIMIHDWTTGIAPLFLLHLRDASRHDREAKRIAQIIVDYQTLYPNRPVFLVGHSGGGAMALLTLTELPEDHTVSGLFLLAPAISPKFPIDESLAKSDLGIWNYYSLLDFPLLIAGTSLAGTLDGHMSPSAGAIGFRDRLGALRSHDSKLNQVQYSFGMIRNRHPGGHFGWTDSSFVRHHLAPIIGEHEQWMAAQRRDLGESNSVMVESYNDRWPR